MKNFSDVITLFVGLPSVEGALVVDSDGLALASSFPQKDISTVLAPVTNLLQVDIARHLEELGGVANQICLVLDGRVILIQHVLDTSLVVFAKKQNLALVQAKVSEAAIILKSIAAHEFFNS